MQVSNQQVYIGLAAAGAVLSTLAFLAGRGRKNNFELNLVADKGTTRQVKAVADKAKNTVRNVAKAVRPVAKKVMK